MNKQYLNLEKKISIINQGTQECNDISKFLIEAQRYFDSDQFEQANYLYQQVLVIDPENIIALNALGLIAMKIGMLNLAIELLSTACEIDPTNLIINSNLALVYDKSSQFDEAMLQYIYVLEIDENNSNAHGELARLNLQVGNRNIALSHYMRAFELNPMVPGNLQGIVDIDISFLSDSDLNKIENFLKEGDLPLNVRSKFYFLLGDINHKLSRYEDAFANYYVANISKAVRFSSENHTDYISKIIQRYQPKLFDNLASRKLNKTRMPVFIVGMPCSGISMVEDILSTNIDINSVSNYSGIEKLSESQELHSLDYITDELMNKFSNYYMNEIKNLLSIQGHDRPEKILNVLPENYLHLGLITLLYPNAYIIHCRRNPLDTCLSNYFTDFLSKNTYSYDQKNVAQYYLQYERLMTHWKSVLPINVHTVEYEELLINPTKISKEICHFIDIEWNSICLDSSLTQFKTNNIEITKNRKIWSKYSFEPSRIYSPFIENIEDILEQSKLLKL